MNAQELLKDLSHFPWRTTAQTLGERLREDRLSLTASSLTFTTTIALVPFLAVVLAVFTAFPMFNKLQGALQAWLVQSLVPEAISRQVLGYLTQFAGKASRLGSVGVAVLFVSALALILTIDRTLNNIWRVRRPRPLAQRLLIYWAAMTLGPLVLGASLATTSYLMSASRGLVGVVPDGLRVVLDLTEFLILWAALGALYRYVPHVHVRHSHAMAGALFAAVGIEVAKGLLALYIRLVPTYSVVYGTFATVPILLIWIYVAWLIVLLGAVVAAYLPSLLRGVARRGGGHGWHFQLALEVLQHLHNALPTARRGLSADELMQAMDVDILQLESVLDVLTALQWIGRLNEVDDGPRMRYILLADPDATLEPLARHLLLAHTDSTAGVWQGSRLRELTLREVL